MTSPWMEEDATDDIEYTRGEIIAYVVFLVWFVLAVAAVAMMFA